MKLADGSEIFGDTLERSLQRMIGFRKLLQQVTRRGMPPDIVAALLRFDARDKSFFEQRDTLDVIVARMTTPVRTLTVDRDDEHNAFVLAVEDRSQGYPRSYTHWRRFHHVRRIPDAAGGVSRNSRHQVSRSGQGERRRRTKRTPKTKVRRLQTRPTSAATPFDEATKLAAAPKATAPGARRARNRTPRSRTSMRSSSSSLPPARRGSPSIATRVSAR